MNAVDSSVFEMSTWTARAIWLNDKEDTAVSTYACEFLVNLCTRATERGVGVNVNEFDSVERLTLAPPEKVEELWSAAVQLLTNNVRPLPVFPPFLPL